MANGKPGRPKGSKSKTAEARRFIQRFEAMLFKKDPIKYKNGLESAFAQIIYHGDPKTQAYVLRTLIQYKLGMPPQSIELSGEVSMSDVIRTARERALNRGKVIQMPPQISASAESVS